MRSRPLRQPNPSLHCRAHWKSAPVVWLLPVEPPLQSPAIAAAPACQTPSPSPGPPPPGNSSPSMPDNERKVPIDPDSYQVAEELAARLEAAGCEYALGGAIALGFWAEARG